LIALSKVMDRVLQWNYYVIPNWHIRSFRLAYWDKFGRPDVTPNYGVGTSSWWIDPEKAAFVATQKAGLD
jgi:microcin C transport system substrate-binding protein